MWVTVHDGGRPRQENNGTGHLVERFKRPALVFSWLWPLAVMHVISPHSAAKVLVIQEEIWWMDGAKCTTSPLNLVPVMSPAETPCRFFYPLTFLLTDQPLSAVAYLSIYLFIYFIVLNSGFYCCENGLRNLSDHVTALAWLDHISRSQ